MSPLNKSRRGKASKEFHYVDVQSGFVLWLLVGLLGGIATLGFAYSFDKLAHIGSRLAFNPDLGWMFAVIIDGMAAALLLVILVARSRRRPVLEFFAWAAFLAYTCYSVLANASQGWVAAATSGEGELGMIVYGIGGGVPPLSLALATHFIGETIVKRHEARAEAAEPRGVVLQPAASVVAADAVTQAEGSRGKASVEEIAWALLNEYGLDESGWPPAKETADLYGVSRATVTRARNEARALANERIRQALTSPAVPPGVEVVRG